MQPRAECRGAPEKAVSFVTSEIQFGTAHGPRPSRAGHRGRNDPAAFLPRIECRRSPACTSNRRTAARSRSCRRSTSRRPASAALRRPSAAPMKRRLRSVEELASASMTAYCARRWRSARFCSVTSRKMPYAPTALLLGDERNDRQIDVDDRSVLPAALRHRPRALTVEAVLAEHRGLAVRSVGTMNASIGWPTSSLSR